MSRKSSSWVDPFLTAPSHLKPAQKVLKQKVEVKIGNKMVKRPRINAYAHALGMQAAKGAASALRSANRFREIFKKMVQVGQRSSNQDMNRRLKQGERLREIGYRSMLPQMAVMWDEVKEPFEKRYGREVSSNKVLFFKEDPIYQKVLDAFEAAVRKVRRKRAKGKPYEVGGGKPPPWTRFEKGKSGNLEGRPKEKTPLEELESGLATEVTMTKADGSTEAITYGEAAVLRIYNDAMAGKARAHKELLDIIENLHLNGMLEPDPPAKLKGARMPKEEWQPMCEVMRIIGTYSAKDFVVGRLTRLIGPVPEFVTKVERQLPKISEIEGIELLKERRPIIAHLERIYAHRFSETRQEPTGDVAHRAGIVDYEFKANQQALQEGREDQVGDKTISCDAEKERADECVATGCSSTSTETVAMPAATRSEVAAKRQRIVTPITRTSKSAAKTPQKPKR